MVVAVVVRAQLKALHVQIVGQVAILIVQAIVKVNVLQPAQIIAQTDVVEPAVLFVQAAVLAVAKVHVKVIVKVHAKEPVKQDVLRNVIPVVNILVLVLVQA